VAVILEQRDIDVYIGLDVGKSGHHAAAVDRSGRKLFDKALSHDEARLREILAGLNGHGKILLIVDRRQRDDIAARIEAPVEANPLYRAPTSMPGTGVRICARTLTKMIDKHFATAAHLASYAGIAPVISAPARPSAASTPAGEGTANSNTPCSSPPSQPCTPVPGLRRPQTRRRQTP
jgi:hypothetical protein